MGYIIHKAFIVTCWDVKIIRDVQQVAYKIFDGLCKVTECCPSLVNEYYTFFVVPDGSKDGWEHSCAANAARENFATYLRGIAPSLDWVCVEYGGDFGDAQVEDHADAFLEE